MVVGSRGGTARSVEEKIISFKFSWLNSLQFQSSRFVGADLLVPSTSSELAPWGMKDEGEEFHKLLKGAFKKRTVLVSPLTYHVFTGDSQCPLESEQ